MTKRLISAFMDTGHHSLVQRKQSAIWRTEMEVGYLRDYFSAVAVKRLSAVEADLTVSNQHEYNGVAALKKMFGTDKERIFLPTQFLYMTDEDDPVSANGELTWYDARFRHATRTEWRMYYPTNEVTSNASTGDSLFICQKKDGSVLEILAKKDSNIENQLFWLFDVRPGEDSGKFVAKTEIKEQPSDRVRFTARMLLLRIGIEVIEDTEDYTGILVDRFGNAFPTTREFSSFARSTVDADPINNPDDTLLRWYEREEKMFMCMERHLIQERLREGFTDQNVVNVDAFIQFSLSVNNRRKSRAGFSFENHLEALFTSHNIRYSHTPITENRSKPDFLFPSIERYKDESYPAANLTMLGAKTTAKDRWRQVLEEADRIERKHLITLEGAISEYQTDEMISRKLQLVIPKEIHATYSERQQKWLYSVSDFLQEVGERQLLDDSWKA